MSRTLGVQSYDRLSPRRVVPSSNQRIISPDSEEEEISVDEYTIFDKFRFLWWRYIILNMAAIINFDTWLLSRLHGHKVITIIGISIPLVLYLLHSGKVFNNIYLHVSELQKWIPVQEGMSICEANNPIDTFFGDIVGSFSKLSGKKERSHFSDETSSKSLESVTEKSSFARDLFVKPSSALKTKTEEIRSVDVEVLEKKLNDLIKNFNDSRIQSDNIKIKDETSTLQTQILDLQHQVKSLSDSQKQLKIGFKNIEKTCHSAKHFDTLSTENNERFRLLNEKINAFEVKFHSLGKIKKCCDPKMSPAEFTASIEKYIVAAFKSVLDTEGKNNSTHRFFSEWLNSTITNSSKLSSEVKLSFEKLKAQLKTDTRQDKKSLKVIEGIVQQYVEFLKKNLTFSSSNGSALEPLSVKDVRKIAKEAIMLYDADKTGLVDYALESSGGSVLGTRCTKSYNEKSGKFSVFGLPLWSDTKSPRTVIQPNVQPGECWAFKGDHGFLVIQLSYTIYVVGFTLEHIPVSLSPTGSIDSAPKDFTVWGLVSGVDSEGTSFGNYSYNLNGEPLQYFPVQNLTTKAFSFIELEIHSNHGNMEYTCLYRFRVHGTRVK